MVYLWKSGWSRYCYETTDVVSFTEDSKTPDAPDYYNGVFAMNKPGRYSVMYINNQNGEEMAVTFDVSCSHTNAQTQGAEVMTCTKDGYTGELICNDCREVIEQGMVIAAEGHVWGSFKTIREADCTNDGKRQRTCDNCGEVQTKTTEAWGHTIVKDKAVAATVSSTGLTEGSHCSECGKILKAQKTVPKLAKVTKPKAPTVKLTTKKKTVQAKISKHIITKSVHIKPQRAGRYMETGVKSKKSK